MLGQPLRQPKLIWACSENCLQLRFHRGIEWKRLLLTQNLENFLLVVSSVPGIPQSLGQRL
jgi:hypothetical protein